MNSYLLLSDDSENATAMAEFEAESNAAAERVALRLMRLNRWESAVLFQKGENGSIEIAVLPADAR